MDETILRQMIALRGFKISRSKSGKGWYIFDGKKTWTEHSAHGLYNRVLWLLSVS